MADPARAATAGVAEGDLEALRSLGPHWYASLLGLRSFDAEGLRERILAGLSWRAVKRLQEALGLTLTELGELVQIRPRTLARRRHEGKLLPEESDRCLRAARVFGLALELCEGDAGAARRWLRAPSRALGGEAPLVVARTEIGAREVERAIGRLEHGVPS